MVMNWLTENFCAVLADVIGGFLDVFGDVVNNIFYWIIQVATENVYVINAERFTVSLATTLISVCVVKNIIAGYFLETDYDAEEDPFNLLVRIAQTEAFILNGNWIFNFLLNFSKHFTTDLVGSANAAGYSDTTTGLLGMDSALRHPQQKPGASYPLKFPLIRHRCIFWHLPRINPAVRYDEPLIPVTGAGQAPVCPVCLHI